MADFSRYGGKSQDWLKLEPTLPEPPQNQSLAELIQLTNKGREYASAEAMVTLAPYVYMKNHRIQTRDGAEIEARSYRPSSATPSQPLPLFVFFHGGGFVFGTLSSEDAACSRIIAAGVDVVIVNVNYRHAPDHKYPTPWHDTEDAVEWVFDHVEELGGISDRVVVGGISAGAYMSASLTLGQRLGRCLQNRPRLIGQLLMIPCLVQEPCYQGIRDLLRNPATSSYEENEFAPILSLARMQLFNKLLDLPDVIDPNDRMLNPGLAPSSEVKDLPPTVLGIAGMDPLRDEGILFAKKLDDAGVPTRLSIFKGVPHGFRRFGGSLSACEHWDSTFSQGLLWLLTSPTMSAESECVDDARSTPL